MYAIPKDSCRLSLAALLSLMLHLSILTLPSPQKDGAFRPPLEVEILSPQKLKQYRTVGIKNGSQYFSVPLAPPPSTLSLQSLRASHNIVTEKFDLKSTPSPQESQISVPNPYIDTSFQKQTHLNIRFDPPRGVEPDELNDAEKIFWSFKKRVYQTFASSLMSTYGRLLLNRPQIKKSLKRVRNHAVAGKMVFDEKGNVLRIKIVHPSDQDEIQLLFEQSLHNIHKIPNPPKGLLYDKELTLYYQLIINRR